ncbi:hypothetical protein V8F33_004901 [Rhypophila sp. PSN 637]
MLCITISLGFGGVWQALTVVRLRLSACEKGVWGNFGCAESRLIVCWEEAIAWHGSKIKPLEALRAVFYPNWTSAGRQVLSTGVKVGSPSAGLWNTLGRTYRSSAGRVRTGLRQLTKHEREPDQELKVRVRATTSYGNSMDPTCRRIEGLRLSFQLGCPDSRSPACFKVPTSKTPRAGRLAARRAAETGRALSWWLPIGPMAAVDIFSTASENDASKIGRIEQSILIKQSIDSILPTTAHGLC